MDREKLKAVIPEERLVFDSIAPEYLSDTLGRRKGKAEALVFPLSAEEVSGVLKFAHENRIPVTPRGAGTNLVGSTVPTEGGIILDLSRMNRILELDPATMTVIVEPGVLLKDLQAYVEERGLFYPPDPGEKASSIGGNISTNAGGMRAVKYGVTRDYVRGLEIVEADGTILTVGGKKRQRRQWSFSEKPLHRLGRDAGGHHQVRFKAAPEAGSVPERPCSLSGSGYRHPQCPYHLKGQCKPHGCGVYGAEGGAAGRTVFGSELPPSGSRLVHPADL